MNNRILVKRLKVVGDLCYEQNFESGVNFIIGKNSVGKTSIIKSIQYGLGGKYPNFVPEIAENCKTIFLEFMINDKVTTAVREIQRPGARIKIYFKRIEEIRENDTEYTYYTPDESFSKFMFEKLKLKELKYFKTMKPSPESKPIRLSFKELFRYFYIRQKDGYSGILYKQLDRPRTKAFEQLLGLESIEINELENEELYLKSKKENLKNEYNYLLSIFQELGLEPSINIEKQLTKLNEDIINLKNEREEIRKNAKKELLQNKNYERKIVRLQEDLNNGRKEIYDLQSKIEDLRINIEEIKRALNIKNMNLNQFDRLEETVYLMSDLPIIQCPICYQEITEEMKQRLEDSHCILCDRELQIGKKKDFTEEKRKIQREIQEFEDLLNYRNKEFTGAKNKHEILLKKEFEILNEIDRISGDFVPSLDIFENIVEKISMLEAKKEELSYITYLTQKLNSLDKSLAKLDEKLLIIKNKKKDAKAQESEDIKKIKKLTSYMDYFLRKSGYLGYEEIKLNNKYIPLINSKNYQSSSDSQRIRTVIAYYYAFLRYSIEQESNFPRFLLIDSPKQQDIETEDFFSIIETLAELEKDKEKFQLIVASVEVPDTVNNLVIRKLDDYLAKPC